MKRNDKIKTWPFCDSTNELTDLDLELQQQQRCEKGHSQKLMCLLIKGHTIQRMEPKVSPSLWIQLPFCRNTEERGTN